VRLERIAQDLVQCTPVPDWVDHQPYVAEVQDKDASCIANGVCRLLFDAQVDLSGAEPAWHYRTVQRVLTREGAERAAHIVASFDPGYQRLEIHFVRVVRGGDRTEHANPGAFQIFRRETNSLLIPDVRANDIVEVAITLHGTAPVLNGKYVAWVAFDSFNPWFESRHRLVRPLARNVFVKQYNDPPAPIISVSGDTEDSRWQIVGQQKRLPEPLTPPWLVLHPALQFSEFESWGEVACLFAPHYESGALPGALAEEIDRLAAAHQDLEQRAAEWLRFVQRELRYFAVSLGEGGLTPRELESIWSTRFGDCKDAAKLYVAGARRMGLEACAALVSTTHGQFLNDCIATSGIFNHCIVRVRLNGTSYWLDPTIPLQSGDLHNVVQPHAGWALPLTAQTAELEKLAGEQPLHILHWEDEITFGPKRGAPAKLCRNIDYFYWAADSIRNRFANEGTAGFAQTMLKELQSVWPGVAETTSIEVRDDKERNNVTLVLAYEIHDCWKPGNDGSQLDFTVADVAVSRDLQSLANAPRENEIFLGRPRKITSYIRLNMPCNWSGSGWSRELEASCIRYVDRFRIDRRTISNSRELIIGAWSLPAAEAKAYGEVAKKLQENLLIVWARERYGKVRPRTGNWLRIRTSVGGIFRSVWLVVWVLWLLLVIARVLVAHP
jgi:transglutaminase-like putative cysteine protease